jgi:hypothetical protein
LPPDDYEPTVDRIASAVKNESPDLQVHDGGTGDPEAPQWNFLFLFPVAMFVMFAIFGVVMGFDH